jgi:hypothetical protein
MHLDRSKRMPMKKLIIVAAMILSALLVCQALSLNQSITIPSSGRILAMQSRAGESQWRGMGFAQDDESSGMNWTLIAQTCASYGINFVTIESVRNYEVFAEGKWYVGSGYVNLTWAISAFHSYGIKVFANMDPMYKEYNRDGIDRDTWWIPGGGNLSSLQEYSRTNSGGWLDIANPASISLLKSLTQELVSNFSIDGMSFDYLRWDDYLMPYGNYDMQQFQSDTGLDVGVSYSTWLADVVPVYYPYTSTPTGGNGIYYAEFMKWRNDLVTTLLQNITQWALAINPNLTFGCTPHTLQFAGKPEPDYYTFRHGQDPANWIRKGLIQWIAPMIYPNSNSTSDVAAYLSGLPGLMQNEQNYNLGGAHGIIPLCPVITAGGGAEGSPTYDISTFVTAIKTILANGADGWLIGYGNGPGTTTTQGGLSIVPYIAALNLPETFAITNIAESSLSSTSKQISWTTSSLANSTVEYNSSQLFVWSQLTATDMPIAFPYWKDNHVTGFLVTDAANVTSHVITLTGLTPGTKYYFRIQSGDPSGIATTPMMMFST